ncbi:DUF6470 family protein [Natroniella sulfidigena]|uniref:DUF6470 family protein n=1 Tax=Natroniella sulfidigena TaxID=723921 RepID=UPI00200AF7C2|nr:DUF6470 family protein [Natroniella sulfidigena]MCK8816031.1 DUF6470 family protein [Natroniella sulfidigena]
MRLEIDQTFGQLALEQRPAQLEIEQPKADFEIEQSSSQIEINSEPVEIDIDYTAPQEDMDIYSPRAFGEKIAQEGLNAGMEGTAKYARQGYELAQIEDGGDALVRQAVENSGINDEKEVVLSPKRPIDINVRPDSQEINVQPAQFNLKTRPNWPRIDATYPRVDIYLAQQPELNIRVVDLRV